MRGHGRNEEVKKQCRFPRCQAAASLFVEVCVVSLCTSVSSPAQLPLVIDTRLAQSPAIGTGVDVNTD